MPLQLLLSLLCQIDLKAIADLSGVYPLLALIGLGVGIGGIYSRFRGLEQRVESMHKSNTEQIKSVRRNVHLMYRALQQAIIGGKIDPQFLDKIDTSEDDNR